jgi:endonuclease/exonuclease/phosphatase family metal-dependent hydrolase
MAPLGPHYLPFLRLVCSFFTLLFLYAPGYSQENLRLRVLSYNIHHAEGVDGRLDVERIAEVIRSAEPDIVALQEVDQSVRRSGNVDQPAELAKLTGMEVAFGANITLQSGHYGNAILSRYPLAAQENHLLPNLNEGEQRGVLLAQIQHPRLGQPLLVLATHFDHRADPSERVASADAVNRLVEKYANTPALLIGDLNATMESETLQRLLANWKSANPENPLPTIPVANPQRQIDFILYRPEGRWKVIDVRVIEESQASDHRPIVATLEYESKS